MKPSTAKLRVVHCPSWTWAGLAWKEAMVGGGGVVGVLVAVAVEVGVPVGVDVPVGVGVTGVIVAVPVAVGVSVGGVTVGPSGVVGCTVGKGGGEPASSPTVTEALASGPVLPWLSVALALMV
jgi:hypothetical protein